MKFINKLNGQPFQRTFLTGNSGQRIIMDLRYIPTQQLWIADFQLDDFVVKGINVLVSPNILRNYKNIIPFGLSVVTNDGQDPRRVDDFDTEYAKLYLLDQDDVQFIEESYYE